MRAPIALLCWAALSAQKQAPPLELAGKILLPGVHGRMEGLAADFYHGRLFVAASGDGSVQVLDVRNNSVSDSIRGLAEPIGIGYLKSSNCIFVASAGDGTVRAYDGDTLKFVAGIRIGPDTGNIIADAVRDRIYVGYGAGALAVLDSSGKRLFDIPLRAHPESFQPAETQPRVFVNLPNSHSVAVVDSDDGRAIADWPVKSGSDNFPMALDEADRRLFVACRHPSRLLVLDMDSGLVVAHLPASGTDALLYDPIHRRLYGVSGEGRIAVYAQEAVGRYTVTGEIVTAAGARTGLFVPEWNRLFVAVPEFAGRPAEIRIYQPR